MLFCHSVREGFCVNCLCLLFVINDSSYCKLICLVHHNKLPVVYSIVKLAFIYWYSILHAGVTEVRCTVTASCERTNSAGTGASCYVSFIIASDCYTYIIHVYTVLLLNNMSMTKYCEFCHIVKDL